MEEKLIEPELFFLFVARWYLWKFLSLFARILYNQLKFRRLAQANEFKWAEFHFLYLLYIWSCFCRFGYVGFR